MWIVWAQSDKNTKQVGTTDHHIDVRIPDNIVNRNYGCQRF